MRVGPRGKFDLRIGNGVSRNGQKIADVFSISDRFVTWHEVSPTATDCEYSADRRTGVLIASTFSKLFDRKVENRGSCIKPENTPKIGS